MRVRILLRWFPVSGPSSMSDPHRALDGTFLQRLFEIGQLSDAPAHHDLVILKNGDASRVISAIFELSQTAKENRHRVLAPYVPDDSAHRLFLPFPLRLARCSGKRHRARGKRVEHLPLATCLMPDPGCAGVL